MVVHKRPTELDVGDRVLLGENDERVVSGRESWLPECLAETYVHFKDKPSERFCNNKSLVVIPKLKKWGGNDKTE